MSVFSLSALDRLIESSSRDNLSLSASNEKRSLRERRPVYTYTAYSPAAIASDRQRSPSPSSFSSPFIVNFKGRRTVHKEQQPLAEDYVSQSKDRVDTESDRNERLKVAPVKEENKNPENPKPSGQEKAFLEGNFDLDVFTDSPEFTQNASSRQMHNGSLQGISLHREGCLSFGAKKRSNDPLQDTENDGSASDCSSSGDEFFDALESPKYGDRFSSSERGGNMGNLDVLEAEVEHYVNAEKALLIKTEQHEAVLEKLFLFGASMPSHDEVTGRSCTVLPEYINERLEVARFVACAVSRGAAKAEAEEELAAIIDTKNREISRLRDKLHYYETINHEMSHRNQECVEIARRQRRERRRKLQWAIGSIAVTACLGMSAAALYKYCPWENLKALTSSFNSSECGTDTMGDDVGQKI